MPFLQISVINYFQIKQMTRLIIHQCNMVATLKSTEYVVTTTTLKLFYYLNQYLIFLFQPFKSKLNQNYILLLLQL